MIDSRKKRKSDRRLPITLATHFFICTSHTFFYIMPNIVMLNLVQWVPLDKNWKIRYPSNAEKEKWYGFIKWLIKKYNPEKIFLFGKQVQDMFKEDKNWYVDRLYFFEHPSYISVYKKSNVEDYKQDILDNL